MTTQREKQTESEKRLAFQFEPDVDDMDALQKYMDTEDIAKSIFTELAFKEYVPNLNNALTVLCEMATYHRMSAIKTSIEDLGKRGMLFRRKEN